MRRPTRCTPAAGARRCHRRLEHVAGAGQVDPRALLARTHDDEREVDHDVGVADQRVDSVAVEDVTLPVLGLGPALRRGSKGRRAIPTIRSTSGRRSSASIAEIPMSPVGPVTATVNPMPLAFPHHHPAKRSQRKANGHRKKATSRRNAMKLISPTDSMFLLVESREHPMHVGGLQLFDPPDGMSGSDFLRDIHRAMSEQDDFQPTFRKHPRHRAGRHRQRRLDLRRGRRPRLPPAPVGAAVARPGARPARVDVAPAQQPARPAPAAVGGAMVEGLEDGRFAVYIKMHHSLIDGVSALKLMQRTLTADPDDREIRVPWTLRAPKPATASRQSPSALRVGRPTRWDRLRRWPVDAVAGPCRAARTAADAAVRAPQDDVQRADRRSAPVSRRSPGRWTASRASRPRRA